MSVATRPFRDSTTATATTKIKDNLWVFLFFSEFFQWFFKRCSQEKSKNKKQKRAEKVKTKIKKEKSTKKSSSSAKVKPRPTSLKRTSRRIDASSKWIKNQKKKVAAESTKPSRYTPKRTNEIVKKKEWILIIKKGTTIIKVDLHNSGGVAMATVQTCIPRIAQSNESQTHLN